MTARLPIQLRIVINQHQSAYRLVFSIAGPDWKSCELWMAERQVDVMQGEAGVSVPDNWTMLIVAVSLSVIAVFIYTKGKSRDRSIFTKPTYHSEIKAFRKKTPDL
jgi:hypothetical protein